MTTNVILAGLGIGTGLLSARLLGPQGRGELAAIQTWPTVLAGTAMLGLDSSVVMSTSRNRLEGARYLASAMALVGGASAVAVVIGWALMPTLLGAQSATVVSAARVFLWMVPIYALLGIPHQMLRAVGAWRAWNTVRVLPALGWLILLMIARFAIHDWANPAQLSVLFLASHIWLLFPVLLVVRFNVRGPLKVEPRLFNPLLQYGLPDMLTVLRAHLTSASTSY